MSLARVSFVVAVIAFYGLSGGPARSSPNPYIATPTTAHFVHVPFLPHCMQVAMVQGDPRKGASVELARMSAGCVIPAHWHTANTQLIFVGGFGMHRLGNGAMTQLRAGDYVYLPPHRVHWFRCTVGCVVYNMQDGRDVVHWVDARGREIPLQATR